MMMRRISQAKIAAQKVRPEDQAAALAKERYEGACDDEVTQALLSATLKEEKVDHKTELEHGGHDSTALIHEAEELLHKMDHKVSKHSQDIELIRKHDHHWGHLELARQPDGAPSKMPDAREQCASAILGSSFYTFGGIASGRSNRLWEMCLLDLHWKPLEGTGAVPTARASSTLTAVELDEDAPIEESSEPGAEAGGGVGGGGGGSRAAGSRASSRGSVGHGGGGGRRGKKKKTSVSAFVRKRYLFVFGGECNPPSAEEIAKEKLLDTHHGHGEGGVGAAAKAASPKRAGGGNDRAKVFEAGQRRDMGDFYRYDVDARRWEAQMVTSGKDEAGRILAAPTARRGHTATLVMGAPPTREALRGLVPAGPRETDERKSTRKEGAATVGAIWLYGGMGPDKARGEQSTFDDLFVLSLRTGVWCPAKLAGRAGAGGGMKLPPRALHTATLVRHRIIVVGGLNGRKPSSLYPDGKDFAAGAGVAGRRASRASRGSVAPNGKRTAQRRMSRFAESKALETEWVEEHAPKIMAIDTLGLFVVRVRLPYEEVAPPLPPASTALPWPAGSPVWVYGASAVVNPQSEDEVLVFGGRPAIPGQQPSSNIWALHIDRHLCQDGLGGNARYVLGLDDEEEEEGGKGKKGKGGKAKDSEPAPVGADTGTGNFWRPMKVVGHAPHSRCHHVMHSLNGGRTRLKSKGGHIKAGADIIMLFGGVNLPTTGYQFRGPKPLAESLRAARGVGSAENRDHPTGSGYEYDSGQANAQVFVMHMKEAAVGARTGDFDHKKAEAKWLHKVAGKEATLSQSLANMHIHADTGYAKTLPTVVAKAPTVRPHTAAALLGGGKGLHAQAPFSSSSSGGGGGGGGGGNALAAASSSSAAASSSSSSPQLPAAPRTDGAVMALRAAKADASSKVGERALSKSKTAERFGHDQKKAEIKQALHSKQKAALVERLLKRKLTAQVKVLNGQAAEEAEEQRLALARARDLAAAHAVSANAAGHHQQQEASSFVEDARAAVNMLNGKSFGDGFSHWFAKTWQPIHAQ